MKMFYFVKIKARLKQLCFNKIEKNLIDFKNFNEKVFTTLLKIIFKIL